MAGIEPGLKKLVLSLHDIGAIKLGSFTLKSGLTSPIYIDLRIIVSYPDVLQMVADEMWRLVGGLGFDVVCGVPYTALPIATVISLQHDKPMLMRRKEAKKYGTKKIIEGNFKKGQKCLIVEDLVTSGISVFETVEPLTEEGLVCKDVVVLVDRQQGGERNLQAGGLRLHAVITIQLLLDTLLGEGRIKQDIVDKVHEFLRNNQTKSTYKKPEAKAPPRTLTMTYGQRAQEASNNLAAARLLSLMESKKTNLCFSADITDKKKLLAAVEQVGPHICLLKTHVDIVEGFDMQFIADLQRLATKFGFLLFEDRKYADIGSTVVAQYSKGVYKTASWSDITNAHPLPGSGVVSGLASVGLKSKEPRGLLLIAQMSSKGNLIDETYTAETVKMAEANKNFVMGFICQSKLSDEPGMIHMTPGVQLQAGGDGMGQQFDTPHRKIVEHGVDLIIVGRGIYGAKSATEMGARAKTYREAGWSAYLARLKGAGQSKL